MNWKHAAAIALGLTLGAAIAGSGFAAAHNAREAAMKHIKRALRPLAEMNKAASFDPAETARRGQEIADYLGQFKDLFPAGSEHEDDQAKPNIWTDRAGFETARAKAVEAALAVAKAADLASFQATYKSLSAACSACHDKYADLK
ncbi:cytochrome c [Dongia sp. agr-C8]